MFPVAAGGSHTQPTSLTVFWPAAPSLTVRPLESSIRAPFMVSYTA